MKNLPWKYVPETLHDGKFHVAGAAPCVVDDHGKLIAEVKRYASPRKPRDPEAEATAEFIARACSSHDDLVTSLETVLAMLKRAQNFRFSDEQATAIVTASTNLAAAKAVKF